MNKRIVFTGGGTAGHVTPNIALIEVLRAEGWDIHYIGSTNGVEQSMIKAINIPYHAIRCGKLRRYFSWQNFYDPLNMLCGIFQSFYWLFKLKPRVVFSKGGFVGLPVVIAAWLNRIPVIAHESDMTPGLANRLSLPFVNKICVTFDAAKKHFKQVKKVEVTGTPIRQQLFEGNKKQGLALCGFNEDKPCLLVMGGSMGSNAINQSLRKAFETLKDRFQIIHLCGKGNLDSTLLNTPGYCQFEYANAELPDLFAAADLVVSRAGSNSLYEILALAKPHILIPLSLKASRGDQIHNARYFEKQEISVVIDEDQLTSERLTIKIDEVAKNRDVIIEKILSLKIKSATMNVIEIIKKT